jgi:hypothetical protein
MGWGWDTQIVRACRNDCGIANVAIDNVAMGACQWRQVFFHRDVCEQMGFLQKGVDNEGQRRGVWNKDLSKDLCSEKLK